MIGDHVHVEPGDGAGSRVNTSKNDLLSPLGRSRYGRMRKPKVSSDFCDIDDVVETANEERAVGRVHGQKSYGNGHQRSHKRRNVALGLDFFHVTGDMDPRYIMKQISPLVNVPVNVPSVPHIKVKDDTLAPKVRKFFKSAPPGDRLHNVTKMYINKVQPSVATKPKCPDVKEDVGKANDGGISKANDDSVSKANDGGVSKAGGGDISKANVGDVSKANDSGVSKANDGGVSKVNDNATIQTSNINVSEVIKIISNNQILPPDVNVKQQSVKNRRMYGNKRKRSIGLESFGLPDEPIVPACDSFSSSTNASSDADTDLPTPESINLVDESTYDHLCNGKSTASVEKTYSQKNYKCTKKSDDLPRPVDGDTVVEDKFGGYILVNDIETVKLKNELVKFGGHPRKFNGGAAKELKSSATKQHDREENRVSRVESTVDALDSHDAKPREILSNSKGKNDCVLNGTKLQHIANVSNSSIKVNDVESGNCVVSGTTLKLDHVNAEKHDLQPQKLKESCDNTSIESTKSSTSLSTEKSPGSDSTSLVSRKRRLMASDTNIRSKRREVKTHKSSTSSSLITRRKNKELHVASMFNTPSPPVEAENDRHNAPITEDQRTESVNEAPIKKYETSKVPSVESRTETDVGFDKSTEISAPVAKTNDEEVNQCKGISVNDISITTTGKETGNVLIKQFIDSF